ncbi:hypothetical protein C9374_005886 [Naegleria lovaniensis]|uniref:DUF4116 domain-containing protein n=1 Tax=Naegleria lovaniensis TaxID=51637 RepID=A0AA88GJF5_NAELO|nr:uncharacterized protein C9374_005886 [Naegleria lovaniensis]KAG2382094.1 hypothetical protein C9374_005886 [Naegleria lovaniensis]
MNDPEFVFNYIKQHGYGLGHASKQLRQDRDFVLKAVQQQYSDFRFAQDFRNDQEVVLKAITQEPYALRYFASIELQKDKEFVLKAVRLNGVALWFTDTFKNDMEVVLTAVKQNSEMLEKLRDSNVTTKLQKSTTARRHSDVHKNLLRDRSFMLQSLKLTVPEFETLHSFDYSSKDIMLRVVQEFGFLLEFVSSELKSDREIVLNAVKNDGISLRFASEDLRNDKEIALLAVMQDALEYAHDELKSDKEIVLEAVKQDTDAVLYASDKLLKDKQFLLQIAKFCGNMFLEHVPREITDDADFMLEIMEEIKNSGVVSEYNDELYQERMEQCYYGAFIGKF